MRVLVIEDDAKIAGFIQKGLEMEQFSVDVAGRGDEGLEFATTRRYDLIILDMMLPGLSGQEVLTQLREHDQETLVIVVTARDQVEDRVAGLEAGADDYVLKPFSFAELIARIRAHSRRQTDQQQMLTAGVFVLDRLRVRVTRGGKAINLSPREYQLFTLFMQNVGRVLSRATIADRVWGYQFDSGTNVIDVYVNYLRKKIDDRGEQSHIRAVRGVGYVFSPEDPSVVEIRPA